MPIRRSTPIQPACSANQDVYVSAVNDVKTLVIVGSGGGGIAGVAGSIDVGVVRNDVTAFIAGSDVNAKRDIAVNALANREVQSYAVSVGGGVVGVAGAISVYVLGGNLDSTYTVSTNDSGGTASDNALLSDDGTGTGIGSTDGDLTITGLTDILGDFMNPDTGTTQDEVAQEGALLANGAYDDSGDTLGTPITTATGETVGNTGTVGTQTVPRGVSAFIGSNAGIDAGRNVDLDARERIKMTMVTGSVGGGAVGAGASITILVLDDPVQAFIGEDASVEAGSDVTLDAALTEDVYGLAVAGQLAIRE